MSRAYSGIPVEGRKSWVVPRLVKEFFVAFAVVAIAVVAVELVAISYIRHRFMDTPFLAATFQVIVGGALVFVAGILIGSS